MCSVTCGTLTGDCSVYVGVLYFTFLVLPGRLKILFASFPCKGGRSLQFARRIFLVTIIT